MRSGFLTGIEQRTNPPNNICFCLQIEKHSLLPLTTAVAIYQPTNQSVTESSHPKPRTGWVFEPADWTRPRPERQTGWPRVRQFRCFFPASRYWSNLERNLLKHLSRAVYARSIVGFLLCRPTQRRCQHKKVWMAFFPFQRAERAIFLASYDFSFAVCLA